MTCLTSLWPSDGEVYGQTLVKTTRRSLSAGLRTKVIEEYRESGRRGSLKWRACRLHEHPLPFLHGRDTWLDAPYHIAPLELRELIDAEIDRREALYEVREILATGRQHGKRRGNA